MFAALTLTVAACRSETPPQSETASAPAADASHVGYQAGKVFVEPKDGATLSSKQLAKFVFGSENDTDRGGAAGRS